jgi:uncharacterized protein involved in exopolysaccharide biosynthesis
MKWEDREPDFQAVMQETNRLFSRAKRRKLLVLVLTLVCTLGAAFREYRRQRTYPATVVLSATEGEAVMDGSTTSTTSSSPIASWRTWPTATTTGPI